MGHLPHRTCLPRTGCTPIVSLDSLDAIFFTSAKQHMQECLGASVTALKMANVSGLPDIAGRHGVMGAALGLGFFFLSGICQCTMRGFLKETIC